MYDHLISELAKFNKTSRRWLFSLNNMGSNPWRWFTLRRNLSFRTIVAKITHVWLKYCSKYFGIVWSWTYIFFDDTFQEKFQQLFVFEVLLFKKASINLRCYNKMCTQLKCLPSYINGSFQESLVVALVSFQTSIC